MSEIWLVRKVVKRLWHNLEDAGASLRYILTESRVGYLMAVR